MFGIAQAVIEACGQASVIHFKLDGIDLRKAWLYGRVEDPYLSGPAINGHPSPGVTNWEFALVIREAAFRAKTVFWQNGGEIPLSRVLVRSGGAVDEAP